MSNTQEWLPSLPSRRFMLKVTDNFNCQYKKFKKAKKSKIVCCTFTPLFLRLYGVIRGLNL